MIRLTRRSVLISTPFGPFLKAGTMAAFYDVKPPSEWSAEAIARLTTASPWAVRTRAKRADATDNTLIPGRTKIGGGKGSMGSSAPLAFYGETIVTWESAEPIRLVRREALPAQFTHHYVIQVTGLPPQARLTSICGR